MELAREGDEGSGHSECPAGGPARSCLPRLIPTPASPCAPRPLCHRLPPGPPPREIRAQPAQGRSAPSPPGRAGPEPRQETAAGPAPLALLYRQLWLHRPPQPLLVHLRHSSRERARRLPSPQPPSPPALPTTPHPQPFLSLLEAIIGRGSRSAAKGAKSGGAIPEASGS